MKPPVGAFPSRQYSITSFVTKTQLLRDTVLRGVQTLPREFLFSSSLLILSFFIYLLTDFHIPFLNEK